jgi:hypothetical protein
MLRRFRYDRASILVLLLLLIVAVPVSAAVITLNPGDSIQTAVNTTVAGDTIVLNAGIYNQHAINVSHDIIIRANTSAGGSAQNTIIDGSKGRDLIFWSPDDVAPALVIDNLTLLKMNVVESGFAIGMKNGSVTVTGSTITNCSSLSPGSAISLNSGDITVIGSTISNCTSVGNGSALSVYSGTVTVIGSTLTELSAHGNGGAIHTEFGSVNVIGSTISECISNGDGGAISMFSGNVTLVGSNVSECMNSGNGGAIAIYSGNVTLADSTISECMNTGNGGAISMYVGNVTLVDSTVFDCTNTGSGGALSLYSGEFAVIRSTISNCTAIGDGGALFMYHSGNITVTGSTIVFCSAGIAGAIWGESVTVNASTISDCMATAMVAAIHGNAVLVTSSTITNCSVAANETDSSVIHAHSGTIRFSWLVGNSQSAWCVYAYNISEAPGNITASYNWWGSNSQPARLYNTTASPWLVLGGTATPPFINLTGTSAIRANLTCDSDGTYHDPAREHVPDGFPLQFALTSGKGTLLPSVNRTVDGSAGTRFSPLAPGIATVNVTGDHQSIFVSVPVLGNATDLARMTLPDSSLYQNTDTRIPISVMHLTAGTGMSFNLTYDPTVIRINEITLNESYASASSLEVNATPGLVRLSLTCTDGITIGSAVPLFLLNTTGTGAIGSLTPLALHHAQWSEGSFVPLPFDTVDGSALVYRIRGDLNGNAVVDIGDTAKTAFMVVNRIPHLIPDADFNNNGRIDVGDASKIARYLVGKIAEL